MKQTPLLLLILAVLLCGIGSGTLRHPAAKLTVSWLIPTLNNDGSPLTDLAGFYIQWGSCTPTGTVKTVQGGINATAKATSSPIYPTNLNPVCVQAFAVNSAGALSAPAYASSAGLNLPATLSQAIQK
jgi:hypothetical protein